MNVRETYQKLKQEGLIDKYHFFCIYPPYSHEEIGIRKEVAEKVRQLLFLYVCMLFCGGGVGEAEHRGVALGFGFEAQGVGA